METVDKAFNLFKELVMKFEVDEKIIENEADLRFRFLDDVLLSVLGWAKEDLSLEAPSENGYSDYLFKIGSRSVAVLEAKRASTKLIETAKLSSAAYIIRGPVLKPASDGIKQAKQYASDHSCALASVSNGKTWLFFLTNRQDGLPFLDGQAITYPNLASIIADFSRFYDLLSKEGISEKRYVVHFGRIEGTLVTANVAWSIAVDDRSNPLVPRDRIAKDLDRVFDRFFKSLTNEDDAQMLVDCFVDTKESRFADETMQRLAEEVLSDLSSLSTGAGEELQEELAEAIASKIGEIVLIIGTKGAGKTTFIDRFFRVVLPREIRNRCLVLRADLAEATQDESQIDSWLTERLIEQAESKLFRNGTPEFNDLQGIYYAQYNSLRYGELRHLYESNKNDFQIRFGEWVISQRLQERYSYLIHLLQMINAQRQLMPCIIFDNADQFPQSFQERVFQYGYALYRATISFIIVPITDRTVWQLGKSGPLQSYSTKQFYLPVPPMKEILERRVAYLRMRSSKEKPETGKYFSSRGIRLSISNISAFAATVEEVFIRRDFVNRSVSWLSNLDLRRTLELMQRMLTSPALKIDELVTAYVADTAPEIQDSRITRSLVAADRRYYDEPSNGFVHNLFVVPHDRLVSPMLRTSILQLLLSRIGAIRADQKGEFLDFNSILSYFEPCGVGAIDLIEILLALVKVRLVEPYDLASEAGEGMSRIRISHSGRMHLEFALNDPQYVGQMALRTQIKDANVVATIASLNYVDEPAPWFDAASIFASYILKEDASLFFMPKDVAYDSQRIMRNTFAYRWTRMPIAVKTT